MNGSIDRIDRRVFVALGALLASSHITRSVFVEMSIIWQELYTFATRSAQRGFVLEGTPDVLGSFAGDIIFGIIAVIAGGAVGFVIHAVIFRSTQP